jgi:hypothetical protein
LKHIKNVLNYIEIHYQYNEVYSKYTQCIEKTFEYFGVF